MSKIILYLENDDVFRSTLASLLDRYGYRVLPAASIEEAYDILRRRFVHMALVDIRMEDDNATDDVSGLTFALDDDLLYLPKIVLTAFPDFQHVREGRRPRADGRAPVLEFLTKDQGPLALVEAIGKAFDQSVPLNWSLRIQYAPGITKEYLASLINQSRGDAFVRETEIEFDSVLRRTFHEYDHLSINRLLATRADRIWLDVTAFNDQTLSHALLMVGPAKSVVAEFEAYKVSASRVHTEGAFVVNPPERMWRLAALVLQPVGVMPEDLVRLNEYFLRHPAETIAAAIENLYTHTLQLWHTQGHEPYPTGDLFAAYLGGLGIEEEKIAAAQALQDKKDVVFSLLCTGRRNVAQEAMRAGLADVSVQPDGITIHTPGAAPVTAPNPEKLFPRIAWEHASTSGLVHGHLSLDVVFVAGAQQTWLIDVLSAQVGPLLRDYVALEADIVCHMLDDTPLPTRLALASRLYHVATLREVLTRETDTPAAAGAMAAVQSIRQAAAKLIDDNLKAYYVGIWFHYLQELDRFDPNLRYSPRQLAPMLQALVNLCFVSDGLVPTVQDATFVFDPENRVVYVNGRAVNLTRQEFLIMQYLYQNRNRVCSRREIVEQGLHESFEGARGDNSRLTSAIKRLRDKIQGDTPEPVYIEAVHGHGYRLNVPEA